MKFGYREVCLRHETGSRHPENPDRLRAIRRGLARKYGVEYAAPADATVEDLSLVHDLDYVMAVREFCADGGGSWDPDTVAVEATWDAACASAGLACWAAEAALDGAQGRNTPFSLGRPPGHHAEADEAMGFCFFNNAAIAADRALDWDGVDRVAVVDWDVHHGNGTQKIFYDRGDVFYASIHEQGLYPGTGAVDEIGSGEGTGTTLNVAFPGGSGDPDYLAAVEDVITPAVAQFDPDLLLVSAGFDAHRHDPISRMRVSTEGYGLLTTGLRAAADGWNVPVAFVLEGGYSLDALAESVGMVHKVFHGYAPAEPDGEPDEDALAVIADVRKALDLE